MKLYEITNKEGTRLGCLRVEDESDAMAKARIYGFSSAACARFISEA